MATQPKRLSLIGKRHRIEWGCEGLAAADGDEAQGLFIASKKVIKIAAGQTHDDERESLLHEILHALEVQMDATIPEAKLTKLAIGIYAALKDNPRLVAYLLEEEDDGDAGDRNHTLGGDDHGCRGGTGSGGSGPETRLHDGEEHRGHS